MNYYKNKSGQTVLKIAIRKWPDRKAMTLSVIAFRPLIGMHMETVVLKTVHYSEEELPQADRMQTLRTLALLVALEIGEPDPFITGNDPVMKEPVINIKHRRKQS